MSLSNKNLQTYPLNSVGLWQSPRSSGVESALLSAKGEAGAKELAQRGFDLIRKTISHYFMASACLNNFSDEKCMVYVGAIVRSFTVLVAFTSLTLTSVRAQTSSAKTVVIYPSGFSVSQPLSELPIEQALFTGEEIHEPGPGPLRSKNTTTQLQKDLALQTEIRPMVPANQMVDFDGIFANGSLPSDSNLAVGLSEIVEVVNIQFAVYNKAGVTLAGPTKIKRLFSTLTGDCSAGSDGDPVVLYDRPADRWLISMIGKGAGTTSECVAVSKTNDPTGAYYLYGYAFGSNLNDYPKLSTWATATNSAYLGSYNIFVAGRFVNAELCGFNRTKMLAGDPTAAQLCATTPSSEFGYLPSDVDGPMTPTDGTPGLFISWYNNSPGQLYLRKLTMDFALATATLSSPTVISVADSTLACGKGGACVPQAGTTQTLDSLGDRLMYRFAIRHFADHDRAVVNHSVGTSTGQVGIRWYELYDPAGGATLNQQGTFAPADTNYRWMGSLAEDQNANIGLGYSLSSSATYPNIGFTGRVPGDPLGTMDSEDIFVAGTGSQSGQGLKRWGDYTAMQVDPSDDCTFWYVNQYEQVTGVFNWHTNIGSFIFNGCSGAGGGPVVSLTPTALTWGNVPLNTTAPAKSVSLSNTGGTTLNITNIVTTGDFALITSPKPCGSTLAAESYCVINVAFTPTQLGKRTGNLAITDDASNSPQTAVLSGVGITPVALTPTRTTFASQNVGTTSASAVFSLTNNLSTTLSGIVISTTGDFSVASTTCATNLSARAKCTISVVFTPTATGTRSGILNVEDSANNSPQISNLSGTGK